jgi:hypothetical protein
MVRFALRATRALIVAATLTALAACTERRVAERADSDLSRDLALASQINAPPALNDSAVTPTPSPERRQPAPVSREPRGQQQAQQPVQNPPAVQTPAPDRPIQRDTQTVDSSAGSGTPPAPAPAPVKLIAAGTGLALSSGMQVCTNTNKVGDKLVATVTAPVEGTNGALIPEGSRVVLEVSRVTPGDSPDSSGIDFRPLSLYVGGVSYGISGAVLSTTPVRRTEAPDNGVSDKTKVLGGAVAGAILGQILGKDTKSTIIGAAAGAATGAAVAKAQESHQACLPQGASLVLTLSDQITMN